MNTEKCFACGARSDLVTRQLYVGGRGYEATVECREKMDCFNRQNLTAFSDQLQAELEQTREQRRVVA